VAVNSNYDSEIQLQPDEYRISVGDIQDYINFKNNIIQKMPAGSSFTVELAFNGNGLLPVTDQVQVDGNRYVEIDYIKPMGTGMKNWPVTTYEPTNWSDDYFSHDELYKYFKVKENRSHFYWSSHTFTHENLDNASRSDVDNEIRLNIEIAKMLDLDEEDWWSGKSIITPQISGLHNGDALEIFRQYGIVSATGDISRADITNVTNYYHPFITTKETSNVENFPIIPRSPAEVYYYSSTPEENTYIYNYMYHTYFGGDSTWEELLERESSRVLRLMMLLRHEAHQFHQANMRSDDKTNHRSILQQWVEAVVNLYTKYVDWPLVSYKLDDLNQLSIDRYNADLCNASYKLNIEKGFLTDIIITSPTAKVCVLPLTVPGDVIRKPQHQYEQLGNDPLTVWVTIQANADVVSLDPPIPWEYTYVPTDVPTNSAAPVPTTTTTTTKVSTVKTTTTTTKVSTVKTTTTTTKAAGPTGSSMYRNWYDDFFNTDWYTCGNQDYICKQHSSDNCYNAVNSCWGKVPYPESNTLCNEMNGICGKIWTIVK